MISLSWSYYHFFFLFIACILHCCFQFRCSLSVALIDQLVKNLPTMQEIPVWSLGWEDTLEKGKVTHSSILAWRIPRTMYIDRVRHSNFHFHFSVAECCRSQKIWTSLLRVITLLRLLVFLDLKGVWYLICLQCGWKKYMNWCTRPFFHSVYVF